MMKSFVGNLENKPNTHTGFQEENEEIIELPELPLN